VKKYLNVGETKPMVQPVALEMETIMDTVISTGIKPLIMRRQVAVVHYLQSSCLALDIQKVVKKYLNVGE
jgi:hypothetical protein